MFCVLVNSFAPSATFEPLVKAFLLVHSQQEETPVGIMAKCELPALISRRKLTAVDCSAKLDVLITQGARGKILTVGEIETASVSLFSKVREQADRLGRSILPVSVWRELRPDHEPPTTFLPFTTYSRHSSILGGWDSGPGRDSERGYIQDPRG
jgi:hypothetical protein